jgi:hypothetical protein
MSELSTLKDRATYGSKLMQIVWELLIFVPLIILLLIIADGIFLNLASERSEYFKVEKVANETYRQYSQKLDAISKKFAKELEAINKEN